MSRRVSSAPFRQGSRFARRRQALLEVPGREGPLGRRHGGLPVGGDVAGVDEERLVLVGADAVALAHLAEVHGLVLVPQDRLRHLLGRAGQLRQRRRDRVEVLHRRQRDRDPGHPAELRGPDAGGGDDHLRADLTVTGMDGGDPPAGEAEAGDLHPAVEAGPAALRLPRHRLGRPGGPGLDVGGHVERPEDALREQGDQLPGLARVEQMGLQAPAHGVPEPALEVGEPFGGPRHLEAAHAPGAGLAFELQAGEEVHRALREGGHRLRGVDLEDEARRVGGGPAGLEEGPLVEDDHVPPPEPGQVIRHAAAGDAGADDDGPGVGREVDHLPVKPWTGRISSVCGAGWRG